MTSDNPLGLRPFQLEAVDKLAEQPGRLIADDPGLGKTFMAGELDRRARNADSEFGKGGWRPTLVLCPKALLFTWGEWYARYLPDLRVEVINPSSRQQFLDAVTLRTADVYVIHYDALRLKTMYPTLAPVEWFHVIADEAHRISNRKTETSKCVRALRRELVTELTGTPADRAPDQLWALLNFLYPKTWTSYWSFRRRYVSEFVDPRGYKVVTGANKDALPDLHHRIDPYFIRRRKREVLTELPEKQYTNVWVDLSPKQRRAYKQMADNMLAWIGENEDEPLQASVAIARLIRLQQIALATPEFVEVTRQVRQYWTSTEEVVRAYGGVSREYLRDRQGRRIHAGLPTVPEQFIEVHLDDPSSKLDATMDIIDDIAMAGEQVVVFSQFSRAIDLLCRRLEKAGIPAGKYTGGTRQTTRTKIERAFAQGELTVFAGTIAAGGVGLNLQTAGTEIFLDRAWTGGANLQTEDRIHRIGQRAETVNIIDIMARDTIDQGRHQHFRRSWREVQRLLMDKSFDWTHSLIEGFDGEDVVMTPLDPVAPYKSAR